MILIYTLATVWTTSWVFTIEFPWPIEENVTFPKCRMLATILKRNWKKKLKMLVRLKTNVFVQNENLTVIDLNVSEWPKKSLTISVNKVRELKKNWKVLNIFACKIYSWGSNFETHTIFFDLTKNYFQSRAFGESSMLKNKPSSYKHPSKQWRYRNFVIGRRAFSPKLVWKQKTVFASVEL